MFANVGIRALNGGGESRQRSKVLVVVLCVLCLSARDVFIEGLHLRSEVGDLRIDDTDRLVANLAGYCFDCAGVFVRSLPILLAVIVIKR